jgi:acyl carrier protein
MTAPDHRTEIACIFREALNIELPSTDTDVIATGLLDSLAFVTLLYEIEQRLGVEIPFETLDIDDLRTVDSIAAVVARLAERAA